MTTTLHNASTQNQEVIEQAQSFYDTELKAKLEPDRIGQFVAIEPESHRYFLGASGSEALLQARNAMPGNRFYLIRIGYKTAHKMGVRASRIR
jgi:hypothetical protein